MNARDKLIIAAGYKEFNARRKILLWAAAVSLALGVGFIIASKLTPFSELMYNIADFIIIGTFSGATFGFIGLLKKHNNYIESQGKLHSEQYKNIREMFIIIIGLLLACSSILCLSCIFVHPLVAISLRVAAVIIGVSILPIGLLGFCLSLRSAAVFDSNGLTDTNPYPNIEQAAPLISLEARCRLPSPQSASKVASSHVSINTPLSKSHVASQSILKDGQKLKVVDGGKARSSRDEASSACEKLNR